MVLLSTKSVVTSFHISSNTDTISVFFFLTSRMRKYLHMKPRLEERRSSMSKRRKYKYETKEGVSEFGLPTRPPHKGSRPRSAVSRPALSISPQASLSLPGSPFNIRRGSRGSHQFPVRNGRSRLVGAPGGDRKPLVLSTYLDAQVRTSPPPAPPKKTRTHC